MDDIRVLRDAARRCLSQLRETREHEERRALLRLMVEFWDRADNEGGKGEDRETGLAIAD